MNQSQSRDAERTPRRRSPALVVAAWLIVGVPAVWGVSQTAMQAAALFRPAAPAPAPAPAPAVEPSGVTPPATLPSSEQVLKRSRRSPLEFAHVVGV